MSRTRPFYCLFQVVFVALLATGCSSWQTKGEKRLLAEPPDFPREYRAAWVATATNIDWPSARAMAKDKQIKEIDQILERAEALKLNVLMIQVRSAGNRIYNSILANAEPWSRSVTKDGKLGGLMEAGYDPLQEWIARAHARGIEIHAWINAFRANADSKFPTTVAVGKEGWFDPGEPDVQKWNRQIVQELLAPETKEQADPDVDGVAYDHYFYEDPDDDGGNGTTQPVHMSTSANKFPDTAYKKYHHWLESEDDFCRRQIDEFVENAHLDVEGSSKPWVKLGISPKGIFTPGKPHGGHKDQYDGNYANPEKWLKKGWCDYIVPELYWKNTHPEWGYEKLLKWWQGKNTWNHHVVGGQYTSKVLWPWEVSTDPWPVDEIIKQIEVTRANKGGGTAHFSMRVLDQNRGGLADALITKVYAEHALVPAIPWKKGAWKPAKPINPTVQRLTAQDMPQPPAPTQFPPPPTTKPTKVEPFYALTVTAPAPVAGYKFTWQPGNTDSVWLWAVYARQGDHWTFQVVPGTKNEAYIRDGGNGATDEVAVAAINRYGMESRRLISAVP